MLGTILKVWLAVHLGRAAYQHGHGTPTMPLWKWLSWLTIGVVAEWMLLLLKISTAGAFVAEYRYQTSPLLLSCILIGVWVLITSPFCWLYGRLKRLPPARLDEFYYLTANDEVSGPFPLSDIVGMQRGDKLPKDTQLCLEGTEAWVPASEVLLKLPKPPGKTHLWIKAALANAKERFKPSPHMNYRIVIPALVLAMLVGALLHTWLGERYRFQSVGNGVMMKTDRWTGDSWIMRSTWGRWEPVK